MFTLYKSRQSQTVFRRKTKVVKHEKTFTRSVVLIKNETFLRTTTSLSNKLFHRAVITYVDFFDILILKRFNLFQVTIRSKMICSLSVSTA